VGSKGGIDVLKNRKISCPVVIVLCNEELFVRQITLFVQEVARWVTYLQVGNTGHISEVRVSHSHIPVCEGLVWLTSWRSGVNSILC
jgi:hypothetical protein